jgi:hypothetical protein
MVRRHKIHMDLGARCGNFGISRGSVSFRTKLLQFAGIKAVPLDSDSPAGIKALPCAPGRNGPSGANQLGARWRKSGHLSKCAAVKPVGGNMARLNFLFCIVALVGLPLTLGGCAGVLLVGGLAGAVGGGYAAPRNAASRVRLPICRSRPMLSPLSPLPALD